MRRLLFVFALIFGFIPTISVQADDKVIIFAAASLREVVSKTLEGNENLSVSYASSGILARQISQGAPASIYLSANENGPTGSLGKCKYQQTNPIYQAV